MCQNVKCDAAQCNSAVTQRNEKRNIHIYAFNEIQCETIRYAVIEKHISSAIQSSAMHLTAQLQYKSIYASKSFQLDTKQCKKRENHNCIMWSNAIHSIWCSTVRYEPVQCNTIQCNTTKHNTVQYSAVQYYTIQCVCCVYPSEIGLQTNILTVEDAISMRNGKNISCW